MLRLDGKTYLFADPSRLPCERRSIGTLVLFLSSYVVDESFGSIIDQELVCVGGGSDNCIQINFLQSCMRPIPEFEMASANLFFTCAMMLPADVRVFTFALIRVVFSLTDERDDRGEEKNPIQNDVISVFFRK